MATGRAKKPCIKCAKGSGIIICGGCEQWFCSKHFPDHRQDLSNEMDVVGQQHDNLHTKLNENNARHVLYRQIDQWESASIKKVQEAAKEARIALETYLNQTKTELNKSLEEIKVALVSSRQSDDFTEIELQQWMKELNNLRQLFEQPSTIEIIENNQALGLIRVVQMKRGQFASFDCEEFSYQNYSFSL